MKPGATRGAVTSARRTWPHIPDMFGFPLGRRGAGEFRAGNSFPYGYQPETGCLDWASNTVGVISAISEKITFMALTLSLLCRLRIGNRRCWDRQFEFSPTPISQTANEC